MKIKRLIAALLVLASVLALPAMAASSFRDVHDETTAVNADILRLMGVVNGSGNNNFSPEGTLSRAQFCAMAIRVMGWEDQVSGYTNRTIFRDVTARHWARGYVNLAASATVGGGSTRLIAGVGDGRFLPDEAISYAQAVTILLRMLGYGDEDAGGLWPQGYMNLAASLGLGRGINAQAGRSITRSQAAQLFVNLLGTENVSGQPYYATLGAVREDVILFAVGGEQGVIETSAGAYTPAVADVVPTALVLHRGDLVLNGEGHIVTFLPECRLTAADITLAQDAKAGELRDADGSRYAVAADTPVYYGKEQTTYAQVSGKLYRGMKLTLLLESGKVVAVRWAAEPAARVPEQAQVVGGPVSAATFYQLTGGVENYTILKDGLVIGLNEVKTYDVATYDPVTNTLTVSDLRLPCVYEQAAPSPDRPETITVLGHTFPVLDSAWESIGQYSIGDSVTLLLTAGGQVAGMAPAGVDSTAVGLADGSGVTVYLPAGGSIRLSGQVTGAAQNRLVTVSGGKKDTLTAHVLPQSSVPGDFDMETMTLGTLRVAPTVQVFESVEGGTPIPIDLSRLTLDVISREKLVNYHQNTSGAVDIIVVDNLTGDAYSYGILQQGVKYFTVGSTRTVYAVSGAGVSEEVIAFRQFTEGTFGGVVAGTEEMAGTPVAADVVVLTAVSGVRRDDFFMLNGVWYVNARGAVYQVADHVEGYLTATERWFAQDLETIRAYSDNMTIYFDPIGQKVRIITVD